MGKYINLNSKGEMLPSKNKAQFLINDGAVPIGPPEKWQDGLVCIFDNGPFEAAGFAYDEVEMNVFKGITGRKTTWLHFPKASELAN